jgi:hypothetical protein
MEEQQHGSQATEASGACDPDPSFLASPPPGGAAILRATAQDDDARTVAYEDEDYQGGRTTTQTVNYGDQEELPSSPKGEKKEGSRARAAAAHRQRFL